MVVRTKECGQLKGETLEPPGERGNSPLGPSPKKDVIGKYNI